MPHLTVHPAKSEASAETGPCGGQFCPVFTRGQGSASARLTAAAAPVLHQVPPALPCTQNDPTVGSPEGRMNRTSVNSEQAWIEILSQAKHWQAHALISIAAHLLQLGGNLLDAEGTVWLPSGIDRMHQIGFGGLHLPRQRVNASLDPWRRIRVETAECMRV